MELYEQAGRYLGIGYQAEGGVYGNFAAGSGVSSASNTATESGKSTPGASGAAASITVQVGAPQIQIQQGSSLQETLDRFRQEWSGMGDRLLAELARRITTANENMPGGAT